MQVILSLFGVPEIEQTTLQSFSTNPDEAIIILTIRSAAPVGTKVWVGFATVATALMLPYTLRETEATYDYHRMLGGDLSRRLPSKQRTDFNAKLARAINVYGMANDLKPNTPRDV